MKRKKRGFDQQKIEEEGAWGKAVITGIKKERRTGKMIIVCESQDFDTRNIRQFETNPMNESEIPNYLGVGSEVNVLLYDSDEYMIDLDGCKEIGFN